MVNWCFLGVSDWIEWIFFLFLVNLVSLKFSHKHYVDIPVLGLNSSPPPQVFVIYKNESIYLNLTCSKRDLSCPSDLSGHRGFSQVIMSFPSPNVFSKATISCSGPSVFFPEHFFSQAEGLLSVHSVFSQAQNEFSQVPISSLRPQCLVSSLLWLSIPRVPIPLIITPHQTTFSLIFQRMEPARSTLCRYNTKPVLSCYLNIELHSGTN